MFELFMERLKSNQGSVLPPALPSIKQEFKKSINRVMNYFRDGDFFVNNDHLLVKLLKTLPHPQGDDVRRWYYQAQDLSEGISGLHGIINAQNGRADISQNLFMGGIGEILVEVSRPITMNLRLEDWMNTDAIICLYHPYTDMRPRPLDGKEFQRPIMGDYAVIGIDIALLYVQYHLWRREIAPKLYKEGKQPSIHKWVYQYPLVTAMKSYLDMAMFNRFLCYYKGLTPTSSSERAKIPASYVDFTDKIDECLKIQIETLKNKKLSYPQILSNIPLLLKDNAFEFFKLEPAYLTRQLRWCYLAARIEVVEFLLRSGDSNLMGSDRYYDEKWRYGIRVINSEFVNTFPTTPLLSQRTKKLAEELR